MRPGPRKPDVTPAEGNAIDEVIADFHAAGFDAAAGRLAMRFVPTGESHHGGPGRMVEWLDYYYEQKLLLRFGRPA
jgi:hypothetical protein